MKALILKLICLVSTYLSKANVIMILCNHWHLYSYLTTKLHQNRTSVTKYIQLEEIIKGDTFNTVVIKRRASHYSGLH